MPDLPKAFAFKNFLRRVARGDPFLVAPVLVVPPMFDAGTPDLRNVKLPFPQVIFETTRASIDMMGQTDGTLLMLVREEPGGLGMRCVMQVAAEFRAMTADLYLSPDVDGNPKITVVSHGEDLDRPVVPTPEIVRTLVHAVAHWCRAIEELGEEELPPTQVVPASKRFPGASRAIPNKGWQYRFIDLKPLAPAPRVGLGGTHASPRHHLRRAHTRRLLSGKTVTVRSCAVGKPEHGTVEQVYRLPATVHSHGVAAR
jgi:hypothetical protein